MEMPSTMRIFVAKRGENKIPKRRTPWNDCHPSKGQPGNIVNSRYSGESGGVNYYLDRPIRRNSDYYDHGRDLTDTSA
jgi:hypothetical protein